MILYYKVCGNMHERWTVRRVRKKIKVAHDYIAPLYFKRSEANKTEQNIL